MVICCDSHLKPWRFWTMLAHYHGQTRNAAAFARSMGVSESTTRRYLDLLSDALTDLDLHKVIVVYPGEQRFSLSEQVEAVPLKVLAANGQ